MNHTEIFEHPESLQEFEIIANAFELNSLLRKAKVQEGLNRTYFHVSEQKNIYMYARCKYCKAKLNFKREENAYRLTLFRNHHTHSLQNRSLEIESFIASMPSSLTTNSLMKMTRNAFKISQSKFYYHLRKISCHNQSFKSFLDELDFMKYEVSYLPFPYSQNELPDIFMAASPIMIKNFKQYGQFVTFDVTYNIVKQIKKEREGEQIRIKKWGLGLFLGKNCNNKAIPFCYCFLNSETSDSLAGIFRSFFSMMGGQPQTIITDEQASIESALRSLKQQNQFQGTHLLDTFHIIRNINKKTKNQELIKYLKQAIAAKTSMKFRFIMEKAKQACQDSKDLSIYSRFMDSSQRFCLSQTPNRFHGITISTSYGQKVNDFVKSYLNYEKPFIVAAKKMVKIMQDLQHKSQIAHSSSIKFEDFFHWRYLKILRNCLCEAIFNQFLENYIESLSLDIRQQNNIWTVQGHQVGIENQNLVCACFYIRKCGIPCKHLIKVILQTRQNMLNYIHDRWKIRYQVQNSQLIPKGRPRSSRRNRK